MVTVSERTRARLLVLLFVLVGHTAKRATAKRATAKRAGARSVVVSACFESVGEVVLDTDALVVFTTDIPWGCARGCLRRDDCVFYVAALDSHTDDITCYLHRTDLDTTPPDKIIGGGLGWEDWDYTSYTRLKQCRPAHMRDYL